MPNELPNIETVRNIGTLSEKARLSQLEKNAERKKKEALAEKDLFVARNLPFVRHDIANKLYAVSTPSGCITYTYGTSLGWIEIRKIIQSELETQGYKVTIQYFPEEIGRRAYDEQDIPASYEMYIKW